MYTEHFFASAQNVKQLFSMTFYPNEYTKNVCTTGMYKNNIIGLHMMYGPLPLHFDQ